MKTSYRMTTALFMLALLLQIACKKKAEEQPVIDLGTHRIPENKLGLPPDTKVPKGFESLPADAKREWLRETWKQPLESAQSKKDRAELVRPAPPGFSGDGRDKSIRLTLTALKTQLEVGEPLWYRLEMQNVGSSPIAWVEMNSFFKSGVFLGSESIRIRLAQPNGTTVGGAAVPFRLGHCPGNAGPKSVASASGVSEEDFKDVFTKATARPSIERELSVQLAPGETIVTRPWYYSDPCFPKEPESAAKAAISQGFREWPWDESRRKPGVYRVRFEVFRPEPKRLSEEVMATIEQKHGISRASQLRAHEIDSRFALGVIPSNEIQIELK